MKSLKIHGFSILLFCIINAFVLIYPYSESSEKGWELCLIPTFFTGVVALHYLNSKNSCLKTFEYDIIMLAIASLIPIIAFNLPDPNWIWIMMVFIMFVYIPIQFILFGRGLYFLWKHYHSANK